MNKSDETKKEYIKERQEQIGVGLKYLMEINEMTYEFENMDLDEKAKILLVRLVKEFEKNEELCNKIDKISNYKYKSLIQYFLMIEKEIYLKNKEELEESCVMLNNLYDCINLNTYKLNAEIKMKEILMNTKTGQEQKDKEVRNLIIENEKQKNNYDEKNDELEVNIKKIRSDRNSILENIKKIKIKLRKFEFLKIIFEYEREKNNFFIKNKENIFENNEKNLKDIENQKIISTELKDKNNSLMENIKELNSKNENLKLKINEKKINFQRIISKKNNCKIDLNFLNQNLKSSENNWNDFQQKKIIEKNSLSKIENLTNFEKSEDSINNFEDSKDKYTENNIKNLNSRILEQKEEEKILNERIFKNNKILKEINKSYDILKKNNKSVNRFNYNSEMKNLEKKFHLSEKNQFLNNFFTIISAILLIYLLSFVKKSLN